MSGFGLRVHGLSCIKAANPDSRRQVSRRTVGPQSDCNICQYATGTRIPPPAAASKPALCAFATLYRHIVSAIEIVTGTAFTAIVTGPLFVRFFRPRARIVFPGDAVITPHNGEQTLMPRLVNGRLTPMTSANARVFVLLAERSARGRSFRRIHDLAQSHQPLFLMPWTLMHRIDRASPLSGLDAASMAAMDARLFLTIKARDRVLAAVVQDMKDDDAAHIRFGMRFADSVSIDGNGRATADLARIGLLGPETNGAAG